MLGFAYVVVGCAVGLVFYLGWSIYSVVHFGNDPAVLVKFGLPMYIYEKGHLKLLVGLTSICALIGPPVLCVFAIAVSVILFMQLLVAIIFERIPTVPAAAITVYLFVLGLTAVYSLTAASVLAVTLVVLLGYYMERRWTKKRQSIFDKWTKKAAHKVYKKYVIPSIDVGQAVNNEALFFTTLVATTENIARPRISRLIERFYFYTFRPQVISSGVMQVRANRLLSNEESMKLGMLRVQRALLKIPTNANQEECLKIFAKEYNGSTTYANYLDIVSVGVCSFWSSFGFSVPAPLSSKAY